ncbi:MAG: hypothetical protein SOS98_06830 [Varibaculum sp.]|nr:hypothetical protein [Varibaculum sp.]
MLRSLIVAPGVLLLSALLLANGTAIPQPQSPATIEVSQITRDLITDQVNNPVVVSSVNSKLDIEIISAKTSDPSVTADSPNASEKTSDIPGVEGALSQVQQCAVPSGESSLQPWVRQVRTMISDNFSITNIGGYRAGDPLDHGQGLALDVMVPVSSALGDSVAQWAISNMDTLNIKYVIWKQRIYMGGGWQPMEDRGSVTQNHYDHVHISFNTGSGKCI